MWSWILSALAGLTEGERPLWGKVVNTPKGPWAHGVSGSQGRAREFSLWSGWPHWHIQSQGALGLGCRQLQRQVRLRNSQKGAAPLRPRLFWNDMSMETSGAARSLSSHSHVLGLSFFTAGSGIGCFVLITFVSAQQM